MNNNIIKEEALAKASSSNLKSYWNQWGLSEIASMQGYKIENLRVCNFDYNEDEDCKIPEGEPEHCCSGCMDCLGLSWADFM